MKKIALLFVFAICLWVEKANAQNPVVDSLQLQLKKQTDPQAKIETLFELVRNGYRTNLEQARQHYQQLHKLSAQNPTYRKGNVLDAAAAGILHLADNDFEEAQTSFRNGLKLTRNTNLTKEKAALLNFAGVIHYYTGNIDSALVYFEQSLKLKKQLGDVSEIAKSLSNLGSIYMSQSRMQKALDAYLEALKYDEKRNDRAAMASDYNNICVLLTDKTDYASAARYGHLALRAYTGLQDSLGISRSLISLGNVHFGNAKNDSAMHFYRKAAFMLGHYKSDYELSKVNQNMAMILIKEGKLTEAEKLLDQALKTKTALEDGSGIASVLGNLANIYRQTRREPQAITALLESNQLAEKAGRKDYLINNNQLLSEIYTSRRDFEKALKYHHAFVALQDSVKTEAYSKQLSELQIQYETTKKEQQLTALNQENTIQKLSISRRNTIIGLIAGFFVLAAVVAYLVYSRYKLKEETRHQQEILKQQKLASKAVLQAEENERKRIAGDLHDGIGQLFSAVKMNLSGLETQVGLDAPEVKSNFHKTLALVDESCREVRNISHQMAAQVLLNEGLVAAIQDFVSKIDASKLEINVEAAGFKERLDLNVETVLYRVIQEAVNNVIKHAQATHLDIQLTQDADGLSVMIEDNGKGFALNPGQKPKGLGLQNMRSRIEYLKGTVDFDSAPGKGTVVSIWAPLPETVLA